MTELAYMYEPGGERRAPKDFAVVAENIAPLTLRGLVDRNRAQLEALEQERQESVRKAALEGLKRVEPHIGTEVARATMKLVGVKLEEPDLDPEI